MEPLLYLFNGIFIGVCIAAPVGPIGILCIRRTLTGGMRLGLASGLGAASADTIYGIIAACSMTWLSNFLYTYEPIFDVVGGTILILLGIAIFVREIKEITATVLKRMAHGAFASTFFLTLTNPMTIIAFLTIFSTFGLFEKQVSPLSSSLFAVGVFAGSIGWWLTLSSSISMFRHKVTPASLRWINRVSGALFIALGVGLMFQAIIQLPHA